MPESRIQLKAQLKAEGVNQTLFLLLVTYIYSVQYPYKCSVNEQTRQRYTSPMLPSLLESRRSIRDHVWLGHIGLGWAKAIAVRMQEAQPEQLNALP